MAIYSDSRLKNSNDVEITCSDREISYQPGSVDLHLANEFVILDAKNTVDVADEETYPDYRRIHGDTVTINPHSFLLARTEECVSLSDSVIGFLDGRSSVGRLGLFVENAGLIDPGFSGTLTLELFNPTSHPIKLHSGMRIVQMTVEKLDSSANVDYSEKRDEKYEGQQKVTTSSLHEDFHP